MRFSRFAGVVSVILNRPEHTTITMMSGTEFNPIIGLEEPNGERMYVVDVEPEIRQWLDEFAPGWWRSNGIDHVSVSFACEADALAFRMRWT